MVLLDSSGYVSLYASNNLCISGLSESSIKGLPIKVPAAVCNIRPWSLDEETVDTENIDEVTQKVERLNELLKEANSLADELASRVCGTNLNSDKNLINL